MSATELCGAWGGCVLPLGHNMGMADIPENHKSSKRADEWANDLRHLLEEIRGSGYRISVSEGEIIIDAPGYSGIDNDFDPDDWGFAW